ncbi:MAG: CoB--CoM heterodisulfide reductase iron-sulfur subunit B family protein [Candidatus Fervidibacter sp.]|uniref:CoB--CoM heterodisulfide reductase iron-sulfur subunit B family protein n=1 Tax=Candidatus Fervidibacter sp. TaxID=3100871 RepID=UPI00404B04B0
MKLAYYPGCTLTNKAKAFDQTARWVAEKLGVELVELPQWQCCGGLVPQVTDAVMGLLAPVRILADAQAISDRLTTLCSFCYNTLKRASLIIQQDPERKQKVTDFLEQQYDEGVKVVHFLEVLRDEIGFENVRVKVVRPLKGVRVAPYYGCLLLRPPKEIGLDDPEEPTIMEQLLEALGCEVLDFPRKVECCGSFMIVNRPEIAAQRSETILRSASQIGAQLLVTSCPLCLFNLDWQQKRMLESNGEIIPVPVVYFTQLMALAMGAEPFGLGFENHLVDPSSTIVNCDA